MSVHYKFKSSLDFDTITFDGLHISVTDFRKAVIQQKRLGKTNDFELQITNAQTKEEYEHDNDLIPKNTSLIISRIPQTSKKPTRDSQTQNTPSVCHVPKFDGNTLDLSQMNASEEDKIQAMMAQSTVDYDPRGYQKIRGPGQTGEVPPTYRCYKCHQTGHWIKNCPLPHSTMKKSEIRRNTGIPKSFLQEKDSEKESAAEEIVLVEKQAEVPDELLCSICKDIFRDAVMIPCCGSSFCDDCVRTALLESEENECPDCKEKGTSPGSLIPNRFLRSSVNTFKNETGYERKRNNNGMHEVAANTTGNVSELPTDKETIKEIKTDTVDKCSPIEKVATKELEPDATPPKVSPEREDSVSLKMEDINPIKSEERVERQRNPSVEPISPKHRVEVVMPQRDISHNLEAQTRSEDTFKQINSSTYSNYGPTGPDLTHRPNNTDSYSVRSDSFMRHTKHGQNVVQPPHMGYCNNYGNRTERYYYPRDSYNVNTAPYPFISNTRCRQITPHSNIQPYYQGMSGAMETGTIEDPLEAFNRIMKEKEKRKEMKRLASERHRSSVVKRGPRDPSPMMEKRRHRTSPINERRNRSPLRQEKISSHRIIERDKNIRSHRSHYASNKRSFSRSNSPPQRRYSKSPRRRSRSRSHPRSHSREIELLRNDNRPTKHVLLQSHRADYDKDVVRYNKKTSGRFSETRSVSESGPKETRRHNSKMRENGNQNFDNYTGSRKTFIETDNVQDSRDFKYEFREKKNKTQLNKDEHCLKIEKKSRDNEDRHIVHPEDVPPKQENEKKSKERKKKKEKDDKADKKSKKDKKEKKKRERHKDEQRKHSEHKKPRKQPDSTSNANLKESEESRNETHICRKDNFKSSNEESLDDRNETFTPDININRNIEMDHIIDDMQTEGNPRLSEENTTLNVEKSPIVFRNERYKQNIDNNCSELNTPTSFVDTTPENYAGKWDNFDFSMPNSEDMRGENGRDSEYGSHEFQNCSPSMRNDQFGSSNKKNDSTTWIHQFEERKPKTENVCVEKRKDKRSELSTKITSRKSSPTPSEAISSSSNTSNVEKSSQSKKRRKKSKHKKDKQYHKRSSSAESSKNSRKSASNKHKKSRSEKKKKTKRNESR